MFSSEGVLLFNTAFMGLAELWLNTERISVSREKHNITYNRFVITIEERSFMD